MTEKANGRREILGGLFELASLLDAKDASCGVDEFGRAMRFVPGDEIFLPLERIQAWICSAVNEIFSGDADVGIKAGLSIKLLCCCQHRGSACVQYSHGGHPAVRAKKICH